MEQETVEKWRCNMKQKAWAIVRKKSVEVVRADVPYPVYANKSLAKDDCDDDEKVIPVWITDKEPKEDCEF